MSLYFGQQFQNLEQDHNEFLEKVFSIIYEKFPITQISIFGKKLIYSGFLLDNGLNCE